MEFVPSDLEDGLLEELQTVRTKECLDRFLNAQRDLFRSQVDQLQNIVVHQCKVTGANPLSQEMAAGALSINIGKKPRDLLNPKAIRYMQSIFAIKDLISKKETREISALCGVTVTQVREFFASQRSRVRKFVRLSREKDASIDCPLPLASDPTSAKEQSGDAEGCLQSNHGSLQSDDAPEEETPPGIDADDKKFLEQIFGLMKKEDTFSGQMKLIEWILQINTSAVLLWFLTKGGVSILVSWLSDAAAEEQTTVIVSIFKVLCHLPLHKALPAQMSAILQTVNKLRFYRTSDISNKARVLLSRWSKLFIRSQALKRPPPSVKYTSESQKEIIRKQRISEILSDGSWLSKVDLPEDILALSNEGSDVNGRSNPKRVIKMLPAICSDSSKKHALSVSCPKSRERRKVLLVEHPDRRNPGRGVQVARAVPVKGSRPMSSDDIQKAKMQKIFMQRKYGNNSDASSDERAQEANKIPKLPESEKDEDEKPELQDLVDSKPPMESAPLTLLGLASSADAKPLMTGASSASVVDSKPLTSPPCGATDEPPLEKKKKRYRIMWQTPPAIRLGEIWGVGGGESSKEMDVQTARIRREQEVFYGSAAAIPPNPKDPWDLEMDFDDTLTPEIPTEPPPDADAEADAGVEPAPAAAPAPSAAAGVAVPDLELLAVLLKNPELVFALTGGQGSGLSNAETVALLDVLKQSSGGTAAAGASSAEPSVATSLPSPTPPSERARAMAWQPDPAPAAPAVAAKNPPPYLPQVTSSVVLSTTPNISHSNPPQHHPHQLVPHAVPFPAATHTEAVAAPPLLPTPPRAQSPLLARWPNGLLEPPNPLLRAAELDSAMFAAGSARLRPPVPPIAAAAGGVPYLERAELGEAWSPERSSRPVGWPAEYAWDGHALPERSRMPLHMPGRRWRERTRRP